MITYYTKEGKFESKRSRPIPYSKLHRVDGPAIEWSNGRKAWYINGKLHREDGPAVEWKNVHKEWYVNGKLHRLDGPAVIWYDGEEEWWVNGEILNTIEVKAWIKDNNIDLKTKQHQSLFMLKFG